MIGELGPALGGIASAEGWSVVDEQTGERLPLVAWGLLVDPRSAPAVVGLVVGEDSETIELAPCGRYERGGS